MEKISHGVISGDWSDGAPKGTRMAFRSIENFVCNAQPRPENVSNWEYFQGALLAFMIGNKTTARVLGTGVMIAPGLVITATHIVSSDLDMLLKGKPSRIFSVCETARCRSGGGAAVDSSGRLIGVVSRSFETEDQCGPSLVSWIIRAMGRKPEIPWPKGLYKAPISLVEFDQHFADIEGRKAFRQNQSGGFDYKVWSNLEDLEDAAPAQN